MIEEYTKKKTERVMTKIQMNKQPVLPDFQYPELKQ
jgi:hypothetical protein